MSNGDGGPPAGAMAGRPIRRGSALRRLEEDAVGASAARRRARVRRLQAAVAAVGKAAKGGPGSWQDREAAARPALRLAASGCRVPGATRRRRNAAWHAQLAPAGGFARASAAGISLAAAGPRLGRQPATPVGLDAALGHATDGTVQENVGDSEAADPLRAAMVAAREARLGAELVAQLQELRRVRPCPRSCERSRAACPPLFTPTLEVISEDFEDDVEGEDGIEEDEDALHVVVSGGVVHADTGPVQADEHLPAAASADGVPLLAGAATEPVPDDAVGTWAEAGDFDDGGRFAPGFFGRHLWSTEVTVGRCIDPAGLRGWPDDASDSSLSSLVVEDRGDAVGWLGDDFSDVGSDELADESDNALDGVGDEALEDPAAYLRWVSIPMDALRELQEARSGPGGSPTPFARRRAQITAVGRDDFDDEVLLAELGFVVEGRVEMGPVSEPSAASLTAPRGSAVTEQYGQAVRYECDECDECGEYSGRGFLAAGELLEAAAASRTALVAASWLLGVPLEAPHSVGAEKTVEHAVSFRSHTGPASGSVFNSCGTSRLGTLRSDECGVSARVAGGSEDHECLRRACASGGGRDPVA